jgi:hypothetical protein
MEDNTSTTPSLPSFLRRASLSCFGQCLRKSLFSAAGISDFPWQYCMWRRRVACELIKSALFQCSRHLHAVQPVSHSHVRGRVYRAFHDLDDVVHWYRHRDRKRIPPPLRESQPDRRNDKRTQSFWGNLGWCQQYSPCRLLTGLVAIAWIGWVLLLLLLGVALVHTFIHRAWTEPMHGHFYPCDSFVPAQASEYSQSCLAS